MNNQDQPKPDTVSTHPGEGESVLVVKNPRSRIVLDNITCPYCHESLVNGSEEEHVIGKNFVPKGSLSAQWNLIVRACSRCNREIKCPLENDLSVISMWPSPADQEEIDKQVLECVQRKQTANSVRTGKTVGQSEESITVKAQIMQGLECTFNFIGPPQFDRDRVAQLARLHVAAFFYLITYDRSKRVGSPIHGGILFDGAVRNSDWGSPRILGFQEAISTWDWRLHAIGADGYFKIIIKRKPGIDNNTPLWAWAVEWNKGVRAFGFFGDHEQVNIAVGKLPLPEMMMLERGTDSENDASTRCYREETRVAQIDDRLFDFTGV